MWSELLGGLGFFLIGMTLMTDGLRMAAGDAFVKLLTRLTNSRFKAIFTGIGITAILQSSSATTLTTIGLVSAGVIQFTAAVGVIFGANVGTTATSWLVATIGLKFKITAFAFPLVGFGALAALLGRGRSRDLGKALAGFGMIFVGIEFLQAGMAGASEYLDPASMPSEGLGGTLLMVLFGMVMTVAMQSSSAAVATTLTALDAGTITLHAAAAMVIGQNVGTTVTAAIGAIGANIPAKRTALAHIAFNLITGALALIILSPALHLTEMLSTDPATEIAIFHTAFNLLGVIVLLPVFDQFCALIPRVLPDPGKRYTATLDESALAVPAVALSAVRRVMLEMAESAAAFIIQGLEKGVPPVDLERLEVEQRELAAFAAKISTEAGRPDHARHVDTNHAIDHLARFIHNALKQTLYLKVTDDEVLQSEELLGDMLGRTEGASHRSSEELSRLAGELGILADQIADLRRSTRPRVLTEAALGTMKFDEVDDTLRAIGRIDRVSYHLSRFIQHLGHEEREALPLDLDTDY